MFCLKLKSKNSWIENTKKTLLINNKKLTEHNGKKINALILSAAKFIKLTGKTMENMLILILEPTHVCYFILTHIKLSTDFNL